MSLSSMSAAAAAAAAPTGSPVTGQGCGGDVRHDVDEDAALLVGLGLDGADQAGEVLLRDVHAQVACGRDRDGVRCGGPGPADVHPRILKLLRKVTQQDVQCRPVAIAQLA